MSLIGRETKEIVLHEYDRFRDMLLRKDITIRRQGWQPWVMLERHWPNKPLKELMGKLKAYPEVNANIAVEIITYDEYINDPRYLRKCLAQISKHDFNPLMVMLFPRDYNTATLAIDLNELEQPYMMPDHTRETIVSQIQSIFFEYWPEYYMKFIPYGSQMSGLAFSNSSLNICIELDEPDLHRLVESSNPIKKDIGEPYCATTTINVLRQNGGDKFSHDTVIDSIRLKLEQYGIEYNFNKEIYTESTNLINRYMKMDPRVEPFLYGLKVFGRGRNIFASQISNGVRYYGYTIMALAYLSQLDPPVIPNLQHINQNVMGDDCYMQDCCSKKKFWDTVIYHREEVGIAARYHDCVEYDSSQPQTFYYVSQNENTGRLYWNSANNCDLGELFLDFLHYYGYRFDYDLFAVSLKFGGKTAKMSDWKKDSIAIEDPFMAEVNLGEPVRERNRFQDLFKGSFTVLHSGISFEMLHKKIAEINKYDSPRGARGDRPLYVPLAGWKPFATSKSFLLIGLPKIAPDDMNCFCDRIRNLFATHGTITDMLDLDDTTKQVFFTADTGNANDIGLPFSFTLDGKMVYLVALYNYLSQH